MACTLMKYKLTALSPIWLVGLLDHGGILGEAGHSGNDLPPILPIFPNPQQFTNVKGTHRITISSMFEKYSYLGPP